jgi:hypothetical protein
MVFLWENTFKVLKDLKFSLSCEICYELAVEPVTNMQCSHHFCRACIYEEIAKRSRCPVCDIPTWKKDLKSNTLLQSLITAEKEFYASLNDWTFSEHTSVTKVKAQENVVDGAEELFNSNLFGSEDNKHKISDIKERSPNKRVVHSILDIGNAEGVVKEQIILSYPTETKVFNVLLV